MEPLSAQSSDADVTSLPAARRGGALLALFVVMVVSMTGFGIVIPIVPFFGLEQGETATAITIALGTYSLGQLIAAPIWGRLSDRFGRRPVLVASVAMTGSAYVALAFASTMLEVGAVRFVAGLMAGSVGAAFAAAADLSTEETRARAMGVTAAGFGLGFIIGPAIGGMLAGPYADQAAFARVCYTAAGLAAAAAVIAAILLPETRRPGGQEGTRGSPLAVLSRPVLALLAAVTLLSVAAIALMETVFGIWAKGALAWGPVETGWAFAALGLVAAALQGLASGALARRFGERRLVALGLALYVAGFLVLTVSLTPVAAILGLLLIAAGAGFLTPSLQSLVSKEAPPNERGLVLGAQQSASSLGRVLGPLAAGPAFDLVSPTAPFVAGAALSIGALLCAWLATRR